MKESLQSKRECGKGSVCNIMCIRMCFGILFGDYVLLCPRLHCMCWCLEIRTADKGFIKMGCVLSLPGNGDEDKRLAQALPCVFPVLTHPIDAVRANRYQRLLEASS